MKTLSLIGLLIGLLSLSSASTTYTVSVDQVSHSYSYPTGWEPYKTYTNADYTNGAGYLDLSIATSKIEFTQTVNVEIVGTSEIKYKVRAQCPVSDVQQPDRVSFIIQRSIKPTASVDFPGSTNPTPLHRIRCSALYPGILHTAETGWIAWSGSYQDVDVTPGWASITNQYSDAYLSLVSTSGGVNYYEGEFTVHSVAMRHLIESEHPNSGNPKLDLGVLTQFRIDYVGTMIYR